jgi:hypothetical protein
MKFTTLKAQTVNDFTTPQDTDPSPALTKLIKVEDLTIADFGPRLDAKERSDH